MTVLRRGSTGPEVDQLEHWLSGQVPGLIVDGTFDVRTEGAVKALQRRAGIADDGAVGDDTRRAFASMGFKTTPVELPPKPTFAPLLGADRQRVWGAILGTATKDAKGVLDGGIRISNGWHEVTEVVVPQLAAVPGANRGRIFWHKRGAQALLGFWRDVEASGKLGLVLSWAGAWCPRYVRGSATTLSSHAHATAFDINAPQNPLGAEPATGHGCVFDLVPIAHRWGFYWGGHFTRKDGMHFELTRPDA
jgi:hypothetical protein